MAAFAYPAQPSFPPFGWFFCERWAVKSMLQPGQLIRLTAVLACTSGAHQGGRRVIGGWDMVLWEVELRLEAER